MNPKKPKGVNIDAVHKTHVQTVWPDGTYKSMNNDFNWQAPRIGPSPWVPYSRHHQTAPMNTNFNVQFSDNVNGI